ncbi:Retinol dehydrogenase 14 [Nymphon striatum]|nr:Retinol dehydrogenase 14 [Nymphon striatum]KAG1687157.1 Retinol dehydrogenase 14 [Nymphon striatum]
MTFKAPFKLSVSVACIAVAAPVLTLILIRQYCSRFRWGKCRSKASMKGKTVIITGANSGLGKVTASELAKRGARVICACRDLTSGRRAIEEIRKYVKSGDLVLQHLDLASFSSIHAFSQEVLSCEPRIDVLINNAGVYSPPYSLTENGFEMQLGINHVGHFLLTNLLLPKLQLGPSRIIIVASSLYKYGNIYLEFLKKPESYAFNRKKGYSDSKLANVLFSRELMKNVQNYDVDVYSVCPGMVWTKLGRHSKIPWWKMILLAPFAFLFVRRPIEGCQTILHCAIDEKVKPAPDHIFKDCKAIPMDIKALDDKLCKELWDITSDLTKLNKKDFD